MEFLQGNWFSILAVAAYVVTELVKRGKKDQKMDGVSEKLDTFVKDVMTSVQSLATSFAAHERRFNEHVANSDIHVTEMLLELLKERHDYNKNEFSNTRTDIQRVESMLSSMMK
jgi:hypothetical protein